MRTRAFENDPAKGVVLFLGWRWRLLWSAWRGLTTPPQKRPRNPDLLFEAHSSALDLVFYEGEQFPREYKGSFAFVALKGSWNSSEPTGYKVVRVPSCLRIGKVEPSAHYFDFTFAGLFGAFRIYRVWIQVGVG